MHEVWEVSFQFYIALFETGQKKCLLRLTNTETNDGHEGDRIPAIFLHNENQQLEVQFGLDGSDNYNYLHKDKTSAKTWHNITVQRVLEKGEFYMRAILNEEMLFDRRLLFWPSTFDNVKVYVGDQFFPPAIRGWIDQLNITTGKTNSLSKSYHTLHCIVLYDLVKFI